MAQIKKLKDNNNNTVYPMTQASAVFLNNGEQLSDYYLIKGMVASNKGVSDLFNNRTYFNDDGSPIKDPTLYLIKIKHCYSISLIGTISKGFQIWTKIVLTAS